jgi:hypothetical protein
VLTLPRQDSALRKRSKARRNRSRRSARARAFLSHADGDRSFVARLAKLLSQYGVPVWYSSEDLLGAQQWHDRIGGALQKCRWFVLILSPRAVRSRWVKRELIYALDDPRYEDRIIPVLYRNCDSDRLSVGASLFPAGRLHGWFRSWRSEPSENLGETLQDRSTTAVTTEA